MFWDVGTSESEIVAGQATRLLAASTLCHEESLPGSRWCQGERHLRIGYAVQPVLTPVRGKCMFTAESQGDWGIVRYRFATVRAWLFQIMIIIL